MFYDARDRKDPETQWNIIFQLKQGLCVYARMQGGGCL